MKYFFIFFTIFSFTLFSLEQIKNEEKDNRPGSRTIYVKNHSNNYQDELELKLRNCNCDKKKSVCYCWHDNRSEDQPFIQGHGAILFRLFIKYKNLLPHFLLEYKEEEGWIFTIPSPEKLIEMCKAWGFDYFELVPGNKPLSVEDFLTMLSLGKIPVGKIPKESEVKNIPMLYHAYFHDLFNHFFFWLALPSHLRNLVAKRAFGLLKTFNDLKEVLKDDPLAIAIIHILKFNSVLSFDTNMGTANIQLVFNNFSLPEDEEIKKEVEDKYQGFINFGLYRQDYKKTYSSTKTFLYHWFRDYLRDIKNHFLETNDLFGMKAIRKDKKTLNAYNLLKKANVDDIKNTFILFEEAFYKLVPIEEIENKDQRLLCAKALYVDMDRFYVNLFNLFINSNKE